MVVLSTILQKIAIPTSNILLHHYLESAAYTPCLNTFARRLLYQHFISMSLPDGAFPRVNASMIRSGEYVNCIASVVGMPVSFDGDSIVEFECVDGGRIQVLVSPDFEFVPGKVMEIMGAVQEDGSVQVRVFSAVRYFSLRFVFSHSGACLACFFTCRPIKHWMSRKTSSNGLHLLINIIW